MRRCCLTSVTVQSALNATLYNASNTCFISYSGLITQLTESMKQAVLGLYFILASCAVVLLVPVPAGRHFFVFWKTASSHLIPRTEHAHHNIKELLLDYVSIYLIVTLAKMSRV